MVARYEGKPRVEFLGDGRNVQLLENLTFVDGIDCVWGVPALAVVDGASIPTLFWPVIGGPFEGRYRDASIIHDWYCDRRTRSWQSTHHVFYEAMIVSGVDRLKAKLMYFAVRWHGPRWESRVSWNTKLESNPAFNVTEGKVRTGSYHVVAVPSPGESMDKARQQSFADEVKNYIERADPSIEELNRLADGQPK